MLKHLPPYLLFFHVIERFFLASCHFLCDSRLWWFQASLNIWSSSSRGIVSPATMMIVALNLLSLPFPVQLVQQSCLHLHYTKLANFSLLSPLLDWMLSCGSLQSLLQFDPQNIFFFLIFAFLIANCIIIITIIFIIIKNCFNSSVSNPSLLTKKVISFVRLIFSFLVEYMVVINWMTIYETHPNSWCTTIG